MRRHPREQVPLVVVSWNEIVNEDGEMEMGGLTLRRLCRFRLQSWHNLTN